MKVKQRTGDLVWARLRYCPFWPAKVVKSVPSVMGRAPSKKVCVFFFGSKNFGFVDDDKVLDYEIHREKFVKKGFGVSFKTAVQHIDEYSSDSIKFRSHLGSHAIDESASNNVSIKTERGVEAQLGIKTERNSIAANHSLASHDWQKEKETLIQQIVTLRTENQKSTFALKQSQSQHSQEIQKLKMSLSESQARCEKMQQDAKVIADLKCEKKRLLARLEQFRTSTHQQNTHENEQKNESNVEYDVESIIKHKNVKGVEYLVRWKGYGPDEDSWLEESELKNCPKILNSYKRSIKK